MRADNSQTSKTFRRHVAPFAPLALALLMGSGPPTQPTAETPAAHPHSKGVCSVSLNSCPLFGCETEGSPHALVNEQKRHIPTSTVAKNLTWDDFTALQQDADSTVGQDIELDAQDRAKLRNISVSGGRVSEGDLVQLAGFIVGNPHPNTGESVNCNLPRSQNNDFHIPFASDPDQTPFAGIVAEMIPQNRPAECNIKVLNQIKRARRKVLLTGQLFYDNMHRVNPDEEDSLQGQPPRFSLFEIHPIVSISVCPDDQCDATQPSQWKTLEQFMQEKP